MKTHKIAFYLLALFVGLSLFFLATLDASEDSLDDSLESINTDTSNSLQKHDWIYSTVVIRAYFDDGTLRQGFGLLLKNGIYLTSSQLTYEDGLYPKKIIAKMQDDSAKPLICVAQLQLKAMDSKKGLALLKTSAFTDDYCNTRSESFYHKRIYDKYGQDIFSPVSTKKLIVGGAYYPVIENEDTFGVKRTIPLNEQTYYDYDIGKEIHYGYSLPLSSYRNFSFGRPYFNKDGHFLGIFSISASSVTPVLVKKEVVEDFICEIKKKNILSHYPIQGCRGM